MNRGLHLFLVLTLISQTIFTSLGFGMVANAEGKKKDIVKDVSVQTDDEGHADIQVEWSIKDKDVAAEDTVDFIVSEGLQIEEEQQGNLETEDEIIGTYSVNTNNEGIMTFNEKVTEYPDAEGTFTYQAVLKEEKKNEETKTDEKEQQAEEPNEEKEQSEKTEENNEDVKEEESSESDKEKEVDESDETNKKEEQTDPETTDNEDDEVTQDQSEEASKKKSSEADTNKSNKETKKESKSDKSDAKTTLDNEEKYGFNLELDEIMDLEDNVFDEQHPMDPHKEFKMKLDWNLEDGHNYVAGDTKVFDLPKGIKIQENIEIELTDEHGQVIANAVVTPDKKVELTFTDFVEGHSAVNGWMEIISTLDIEEVEEADGDVIIDPIGEEGELRIPIEKSNKDKTIEKNGTPNKGYNADEINWEVIVNKNKTSLENAKITDQLPEGAEYKEGSLKVTKLRVDLDGNILGDLEEAEIAPEVNETGELIVPLGDMNDAYRVEYVTTVTDDEQKQFTNNATLADDELDNVSAKSTVTINRGEPIKKSAVKDYNPKTGIIEWEIEFNYNQKDLSYITLKDVWKPEGELELVADSLEFQEVSIDENGNAHHEGDAVHLPSGAELNEIADGFEVTGISTDKAYKVTYQTKVKDRVLDPIDVTNTAGFGSESDGSGTHVGQFYGAKSAGTIDYAEKTIEWTIRVNHDEQLMKSISIVDTLGEGLTLIEDSIYVTVGGQPYHDHTVSGENPFTLQFPNSYETDEEILVTYKTEFDADNVPDNKPTNKAAITWTPEGDGDAITKEVEAGTELNKETKDYSWKNGSYNPETKEITWEIITNYRENAMDDLIIQDKPQGNQQIMKDSVVVKELNIAANGNYTDGDVVEGASTIDEDENTLVVNLGETNKAYKVIYKTSLEGLDDMQDEYVNEAEVLDGNNSITEMDAKVGVVKDNKYGNKSGYQDGKQVHWSIAVNLVQQKIHDLKLVDSISENQEFLEDTIKVYHAHIDANGNASKGSEVSNDAYHLAVDQDQGEFTVEWEDEVERAFIVEYSTLFFEKHQGTVRNDYIITGDSIEEDSDDANAGHDVTISQLGSGGGEGTAGYLVVNKIDTTYGQGETSLEGAEFDLVDADTGNVLKSGVTDENGQIDFGRLLFGDYTLVETKVPEGFVTPEEEQTVTIDKAYIPGDDKEGFEYTVENYQPVFTVELFKQDNDGNALEGAEFTLFDAEDKEIAKATTNEEGQLVFEDLEEAGTYFVQETKAPAGYVLDETRHEVSIGEMEKEPVTITAENEARGAVQLTKVDKDTGETLEGVKFVLQKKNSSGGYDTVKTYSTDENGQIITSNKLEAGDYQFVETEGLEGYRTNGDPVPFTVNINSTTNQELTMENEQYKGSIQLIKTDKATNQPLQDAAFALVDSEGEVIEENLTTNVEGEIIIDDLFLGDYQLIETKAPSGYELDETPIDIEITKDNQVIEKTMANNKITDITVEKKWNNNHGDTEPVTVQLLPSDETIELNEENDWKATFKDLDVYDESGDTIDYQVKEQEMDGYNSAVTGDSSDGFIVTNTETISVSGEKTWKDEDAADRPDQITVQLLANGEKVDQKAVTSANEWMYEFTHLDKYDEDGEEIDYTLDEMGVDGYETTINGFDIENLRVGNTYVTGEKTWKDEDPTDRPDEIEVSLTREVNGEVDEDFAESKTIEPDSKGKWIYSFTDLDEFNENGEAYTYMVAENEVPNQYQSIVDGYDITNVRTGTTDVSGKKRWKDDKVDDRPDEIKVNLLQNDVVVDTKTVTAEDDWKYAFSDLDKYDNDGKYYNYTVKEQDVEGYDSKVDGYDITNTRSEQKSIEVTKGWLDDHSEDRPDSVIVYLKQNDSLYDTVEVAADNDWKYEFTDLEAYDDNGQPYEYTIKEKSVEGYETTIDGFDITNLRVGETELTGEKTWLDDDSKDRPEEITVQLLANGDETDNTIKVNADSDWSYTFTELDKYDDQGKAIDYSVNEENVEGYQKSFDGNNITNLRVGTTEVAGEKIWNEVDDRYRPDSITIQLLANGNQEATTKVSDETDWSYAFTGLDKYDDQGKEINYTVEEVNIPTGYDAEVDGFTITNTQESIDVKGEKVWEEVDAQYRPETVTVQLFANDEKEATKEVSSETSWAYEFTDLAKFDKDGEEINYTVEEVDIPTGYDAEVDGFTITNTQESIDVKGEKVWEEADAQYRPEAVTVQLFANDEKEATKEVSSETDWAYEFTDLAKYNQNGEEIVYTVEEVDVPKGYASEIEGYTITNTQQTTDVQGEKTWVEVDDRYRPDAVTVQLFANGEVAETEEVTAESDWEYTFANLAKYDTNGEEISYTVAEKDVPAGYETDVDEYTIINTQQTTAVQGTKTWLDGDSKDRPEDITVNLFANDESDPVDSTKVSAEDDWTYEFVDLPKYDKEGEAISYTVDEAKIDGYEKSVDGFDITNLRVETTEIDVTKQWNDEDKADRPDSITINLHQNGSSYGDTYELTAKNDWKLTIEDLPKFDDEGVAYEYSVTEHDVPGYASEVEGFDITNTRTDNKDIDITKTWLDGDAKDRPDTIEVELLRSVKDGEKESVETYELTAENDWKLTVEDLPTFDQAGKSYEYEVEEADVPKGYETSVSGFDITNVRVGTTEVSGTKTWKDDDANERPEDITIHLFANDESEPVESVKVSSEDDWTYEFADLPKYDDEGKVISYTIDEEKVDGYKKTIDGFDITNLRVGTTEVSGTKTWKDDDAKSRPDTITVNLLKDGEAIDSMEVTSDMDWKYAFTELQAYDKDGVEIIYTVSEEDVEGYETSIDGFDITNSLIDEVDETPETPEDPNDPKGPSDTESSNDTDEPVIKDETDPQDNIGDTDESDTPEDDQVADSGKDSASDDESDSALPSTATNIFNFVFIGILMVLGGTGLVVYRRKMQ